MKTTEAIKYHISTVLAHYKLPPVTGGRHFSGECPICGRKGKFRIDNRNNNGTWICTCGSGDIWSLLTATQSKDFATLAREIDEIIGNEFNSKKPDTTSKTQTDTDKLRARVVQKFQILENLKNTPADGYLKNRGITIQLNTLANIKYSNREQIGRDTYGAMYALATDQTGTLCYLHRTILNGENKAKIPAPKQLKSLQEKNYLSYAKSVAIRLFPVASTLGIAEGIETALSCKQIYQCNTWSTINANFMSKFIAPQGVEKLIIFADTDKSLTGHSAAFACGRRNLTAKNDVKTVIIRWARQGDFNDTLTGGGDVYEWIGYRDVEVKL